jgi:hypothetical protein
MDKTIRRVTDLNAQREETYLYWRGRSAAERMNAVAEIVLNAYALRGIDLDRVRSQKQLVRLVIPEWKAA